MTRRVLFACILLSLLWMVQPITVRAQNSRYFRETGHNVQDAFLDYFDAHGGVDNFGYPLTEQLHDARGVLVQYFQRALMEYQPNNAAPYKVSLAPLGVLLGYQEPPINSVDMPRTTDRLRRYFRETGHTLSFMFLSYFNLHGGAAILGYPISELKIENGRITQYFQRARMEWHPENSMRYQVQLGLLGATYADVMGLSAALRARVAPLDPTPAPTPRAPDLIYRAPVLTCSAAVRNRVMDVRGTQSVNVRVLDTASGRGIENIDVLLTVRFATLAQPLSGRTDSNGAATLSFDIGTQPSGIIVVVSVDFTQRGVRACAVVKTYFLTWNTGASSQ